MPQYQTIQVNQQSNNAAASDALLSPPVAYGVPVPAEGIAPSASPVAMALKSQPLPTTTVARPNPMPMPDQSTMNEAPEGFPSPQPTSLTEVSYDPVIQQQRIAALEAQVRQLQQQSQQQVQPTAVPATVANSSIHPMGSPPQQQSMNDTLRPPAAVAPQNQRPVPALSRYERLLLQKKEEARRVQECVEEVLPQAENGIISLEQEPGVFANCGGCKFDATYA